MTVSRATGVSEAQPRLGELTVVDVRTPGDFAVTHICGPAVLLGRLPFNRRGPEVSA
ncbi:hypothetical protein [Streptomyces piniterrae]|uniref:hypothetical protein n=1 Tax=Streptomyces piniterrae TaxID=2571125 RepID=UPI00145CE21F|nr:hypothetical protein [Streptomyces piniterrae]